MPKTSFEVPAITYDIMELFLEEDEARQAILTEEAERQDRAQRDAWADIITAPGFRALRFVQRCKYPMVLILHPSTRPGVDWQLSRIGWDGIPNGHDDFFNNDLEELYKELSSYAHSGATVEVIENF